MGNIINRRRVCGGKSLPYDYEVEYLESSGTQYIDTGIRADNKCGYRVVFIKTTQPDGIIIGTKGADDSRIAISGAAPYANISWNSVAKYDGLSVGLLTTITLNYKNDREKWLNNIKVDTITALLSNSAGDYNICMFAGFWGSPSVAYHALIKLYSAQITKGNVLVRDFIPVRIGTTGYMYDKVSGKLFGNAGTGSFVVGPDYNPFEHQYLTFIPVEDAVFSWAERATSGHLEYSINGGQTWVTIADGESTPTITAGSKVMWRGDLKPTTSSTDGGIGTFSASGNYKACGNTMSLLFYNNYYGSQLNSTEYNYVFFRLFYNDTQILSAPELPAITLVQSCYNGMFRGCTNLTKAPALPATALTQSCYGSMFRECTSLTTPPELPATTLAQHCYSHMFDGCTSLTTAPELPATTLYSYCYQYMFYGCIALTNAPELPATTMLMSCYRYMFYGCTSLTTAPELPATTLIQTCYTSMFYNCRNLNYIKCLARDISATNCTDRWLSGVASTGTFVKAAGMEDWTTGVNGIPSGWTVVDDNS